MDEIDEEEKRLRRELSWEAYRDLLMQRGIDKRARNVRMAVDEFKRSPPSKQDRVWAYMLQRSRLTDYTRLGVIDLKTTVENFEKVYRVMLMGVQEDVLWELWNERRYY